MCIVIAKHFENHGWVAFKNRDRNYIPEISFKKKIVNGVEILYFWDNITKYCEGLNSHGIGVLSASLMVLDDEKEIELRTKTPSKDGAKIQKALELTNVHDVANELIELKLTGSTFIFNESTCYLLEGAWEKGGYKSGKFRHVIKELDKSETAVRTNHGIWLPDAGYQPDTNDSQSIRRLSSEIRKEIAESVTASAKVPLDILNGLTKPHNKDGHLNSLRTTTEYKRMRTTSQVMIIPKEQTMYVRPVQSNLQFDFWEFNKPDQQTWVELISNRVVYDNLKDNDPQFDYDLKHTLLGNEE